MIFDMRRTAGLVFGWLAVTAAAIALAMAAVGLVSDSVTENRPASLSAAAVADALKASSTGTTGPATTATTATTAETGPTTTTTTPAQPTTTTRPAPRATTTTRPGPPTTVTTKATTSTTSGSNGEHNDTSPRPAPGVAEDRTYNLTGGSAAVRFEGGRARLLWATPKPGFRLQSSGDSEEVDVRFRSDSHESRLRASWDNGPQAEVEEKEA